MGSETRNNGGVPGDDADARARRTARGAEIVGPFEPRRFSARIQRIYLGRYVGGSYPGKESLFLACDEGDAHLWLPGEYLESPLVRHYTGRVGTYFTYRFYLGSSFLEEERIFLVRMSWDEELGQVMCLPTCAGADPYIHFYQVQSAAEWAAQEGYEHAHFTEEALIDTGVFEEAKQRFLDQQREQGWDVGCDPRTGDVWCRRPVEKKEVPSEVVQEERRGE